MTELLLELSARAMTLTAEDRAQLAQALLQSVDAEVEPEVDAAWDAELARRIAALEAGTSRLHRAEDVFEEARRRLAR
jgi:putative addiction module component (TIGR02574 family)